MVHAIVLVGDELFYKKRGKPASSGAGVGGGGGWWRTRKERVRLGYT